MNIFALSDLKLLKQSLKCRCPKCEKGRLFQSKFSLELNDTCPHCGLDLTKSDAADGPAVLLIFVLGTLLLPLAITLEFAIEPPLWVHAVLWGALALVLTVGSLNPLKSYIIALQYKHRASDWD